METPAPYVASLRVYEPLENFPEESINFWEKSFKNQDSKRTEQLNSLRRMILEESPSGKMDGAHILEINGKKYVAPWTTSKRLHSALAEFKNSSPSSVSKFFLSSDLERALSLGQEDIFQRVPHILTETWIIPPRWFALFAPEERLASYKSSHPVLLFQTNLELALGRGIRALRAVIKAFGPGPVEEELAELINWLNVFNKSSLLELDYGGLAIYLNSSLEKAGGVGIETDTSVEDVHKSIAGLESGDSALAASGYERLVSRWRHVSEFERAN
jgi:hypothetical protein